MNYKMMALTAAAAVLVAGPLYANEKINVGEKVAKLKTELALTDDQVQLIKPVIEDYKNQVEQAGDEKERRLNEILSADQMKKLKEMKHDKKDNKKDKNKAGY